MEKNEQEPTYNFPWKYDNEHYLSINSDYGNIEMRQSNTELYLFPEYPEADHIFVFLEELEDGTSMGYRIFREHVDKLGKGAFAAIIDQLVEHGFDIADDEIPSESDIEAYETLFGRKLELRDPIDDIVLKAMANFDSAWKWYEGEWNV